MGTADLDIEVLCRQNGLNGSGRRVLETLRADPTLSVSNVARLTGLSKATVSRWRRNPGLRRALVAAHGPEAVRCLPSVLRAVLRQGLDGDTDCLLAVARGIGLFDEEGIRPSPQSPQVLLSDRARHLRREYLDRLSDNFRPHESD
ncbi:MAG: winged helix-turn-helix domain-containing protein [Armatimonadetes bacterium]|nr:winged helix-turn-helix domain-containing protein [Armatimonadota bacterium]